MFSMNLCGLNPILSEVETVPTRPDSSGIAALGWAELWQQQ